MCLYCHIGYASQKMILVCLNVLTSRNVTLYYINWMGNTLVVQVVRFEGLSPKVH